MKLHVEVKSAVARSPRVVQAESIFQVPPTKESKLVWDVDMPVETREWNVGAIIGPSGCGKSTIAKACYGPQMARHEELVESMRASGDVSLLDTFPERMPIKDVLELLSAVGFSSPPAWLRPFRVLSMGEQFRVMMARAMSEARAGEPVVVDEFTSVVDRTVAQIGSLALAKAVRRAKQQFIAVTCHEDIVDWLQPEWVYRPASQSFAWRSVQPRPQVGLSFHRVHHSAWAQFRRYHYLSADLNPAATCFAVYAYFPGLGRRLVAFDAFLPFFGRTKGPRKIMRSSRIVIQPDYQGLGLWRPISEFLGSMWVAQGYRTTINPAHPGVLAACRRQAALPEPRWKMLQEPSTRASDAGSAMGHATDRMMASYEYIGPAMDKMQAARVMGNWTKLEA